MNVIFCSFLSNHVYRLFCQSRHIYYLDYLLWVGSIFVLLNQIPTPDIKKILLRCPSKQGKNCMYKYHLRKYHIDHCVVVCESGKLFCMYSKFILSLFDWKLGGMKSHLLSIGVNNYICLCIFLEMLGKKSAIRPCIWAELLSEMYRSVIWLVSIQNADHSNYILWKVAKNKSTHL